MLKLAFFAIFIALAASSTNNTHTPSVEVSGQNGDERVSFTEVTRSVWNWPYPSGNDHRDILGVQVYLTSINVAGTGETHAIVQPGASTQVSFNWNSHRTDAEYCPGCIVQWYWGMSAVTTPSNPSSGSDTPARSCYNMGNWYAHTSDRSGSINMPFTAPSTPGMHYFTWSATLDYQCDAVGFSQCANQAFAAICVSGDTDGDGVDDCFDTCPCTSASTCPFFISSPADETIGCSDSPSGEPVLRNDYCGASRASTGFLSLSPESTNATSACPQTYIRSWTATDACDNSISSTVTQVVHAFSTCDTAATGASPASASITFVDSWGTDGAVPTYRAVVEVHFPVATNDWRVSVSLPSNGDHVVCYGTYCSVYNGASFSCDTLSPPAFTVKPAGAWSGVVAAGGSVTFEYVVTNTGSLTAAQIQAATNFHVYTTASS